MFTQNHFLWIAICAVITFGMSLFSLRRKLKLQSALYLISAVFILSEIGKTFYFMHYVNGTDPSEGMVLIPWALPLHLCSLMGFVYLYLTLAHNARRKQILLNFVAPIGLIGSLLTIFMAASGTGFDTYETYQTFIYHSFMLWFSIYLLATKRVNMGWRSYVTNVAILAVTTFSMLWVNSILQVYDGINFFFLVRPPHENLPLLNLNHGWYVYFLTVLTLGLLCVTLVHLPGLIGERKRGQIHTMKKSKKVKN